MAIRRDRWGSSVVIHRKSGYSSSNVFSPSEAEASEGEYELTLGEDEFEGGLTVILGRDSLVLIADFEFLCRRVDRREKAITVPSRSAAFFRSGKGGIRGDRRSYRGGYKGCTGVRSRYRRRSELELCFVNI